MGVFNGLKLTNKGIALQTKLAAGGSLNYTRIAIGDGTLTGAIETLTALVSQKASLGIVKVKPLPGGQAVVGAKMNNSAIGTGFYFREIGVFAQDPDLGEILYLYGNAGATADFIAAGTGGSDAIEKYIDVVTVIGNATSVTATINTSLVTVSLSDFQSHQSAAVLDHPDGSVSTSKLAAKAVTQAKIGDKAVGTGQIADSAVGSAQLATGAATDTVIGNRTIDDTVTAASGADTPTKLFSKLANMVKGITGAANWYTLPSMTINAIITALGAKAPLESPSLAGTPTAATAPLGTNSTQLATTAFVQSTQAAANADLQRKIRMGVLL